MKRATPGYRLSAATGIHRGDRPYQQDQVQVFTHPRHNACLLAVVADGMGGKSGGRKAADQVILTAQQLFERFVPGEEHAPDFLRQLVSEAHLMIKLTAISTEEEPHSTVAACLVLPDRRCHMVHAGDSRIYHFRQHQLVSRTLDQSYVQRLVNEGQLTEEQANNHPQSNLLTGCLGTVQEPEPELSSIAKLEPGDSLLCCSDGLWHYFTPRELGAAIQHMAPRDSAQFLIERARQRAQGRGDNLSLALIRVDAMGDSPH